MDLQSFTALGGIALWVALIGLLFWRLRRRRKYFGAAGVGSVYDMLNEDKRRAVEIIVEQRAEAQDPEDKDGDLPQLENPRRRRRD